MKENMIQRKIIQALKKDKQAVVINLHGGPFHQSGLPDLLVIRNGAATFLEVKRPKCKPTLLQECMMRKLHKAGAMAEVVHDPAEAVHLMKSRP